MKRECNDKDNHNNHDNDLTYLELYMEELKSILPADEHELPRLFALHAAGDKSARSRLIEVYLLTAVQIAAEFRNQGISLADLIQEANIGLVTLLSTSGDVNDSIVRDSLLHTLTQAVQTESLAQKTGQYLAEQINALNNASQDLTERHGKEPSVTELAEYLHITQEEVKSYMKMSLDAIHAQLPE